MKQLPLGVVEVPNWMVIFSFRGGSRCYVGGRVDMSGHFSCFHRVFFRCCFSLEFGSVFLACQKILFCEQCICFIIHGPSRWFFFCSDGQVRIHTRTPRNTTLHHPSTHSDNDTDQKHIKSLHFRAHLDRPRNCLFLSFAIDEPISSESLAASEHRSEEAVD